MELRHYLPLVFLLCSSFAVMAEEEQQDFKPHGKSIVRVFTNWHHGINHSSQNASSFSDNSGFELTRGVIGYAYQFSPKIGAEIRLDTDNPNAGKLSETAYIRNAFLSYDNKRLSAVLGIIGTEQFKEQERNWGYRYIRASAMNCYRFNHSIDAGISLKYSVTTRLGADLSITNGEGAKARQDIDGKYRIGTGLRLTPMEGLTLRGYYDHYFAPASTDVSVYQDLSTTAFFVGYEAQKYRCGVEYSHLGNYDFLKNDDRSIFSVYTSASFRKKLQTFVRYDFLKAEEVGKSEDVLLAGLEYIVVKGVKMSPNYRFFNLSQNSPQGKGGIFYLNFEYKF